MVEIEQTRASACCAWALDRRARGPSHVQPSRVGSSSHLPGDVSVDACDALDAVPRELLDPLLLHRRMPSPLEPTHRELLEVGPLQAELMRRRAAYQDAKQAVELRKVRNIATKKM